MKKLDFPINSCTIDLTEKCNLRCGYCFTYGVGLKDLSLEKGKEIITWLFKDEVSQSDTISINWWGGEPFLRFENMKILTDYALDLSHKQGKKLSIGGTTNTTLLTKEAVDWMNKYKSYFMLSIDGTKEVQDCNRPCAKKGCSSFDMIESNLPYIVEKIPFINSRMSPSVKFIDKMYESFKFLHEVHKIKAQMYSPVFEDDWTEEKLKIAKDQLLMICDMVIEKRLKGDKFEIKHLDDGARIIETGKKNIEYPCGAGRFYVGISTEGVIYPCHRFNKYDGRKWTEKPFIGTITDGIINPDFRKQFIDFRGLDVQKKCLDCELYGNLCDRPCYAVSYDLTGSILKAPDVCCKWYLMHAEVVRYFHKKLKENNLPILGMGGNNAPMNGNPCVCNNLCYLENTEHEVKLYDPSFPSECMCYNTSYNGALDAQTRPLSQTEKEQIKEEYIRKHGNPESNTQRVSPEGQELLIRLNQTLTNVEQTNNKLANALELLAKVLSQK